MGKTIKIIRVITRVAVLLPSVFCAFSVAAQISLSERLNYVLETQNMDMGLKLYQEITDTDIKQLADSSLFNYHYLGAYINSELLPDNERNYEKALSHFLEAKRLCETSIGVHSGDYMEIMRGLGDTYIELEQCEEAVNIYQEGIVKSMYMREAAPHDFGNLIIGLQECYERLGWFGEIPSHLQDAWIFWKKDFEPFDSYNYYPLWELQQFYRRYGMNDRALVVSNHIINFISEQAGSEHPEMAEALYYRGNLLVDMGRHNEGIEAYKDGIAVLRKKGDNSNMYENLAGNLFMALISSERFDECDGILEDIKNYSKKTNKLDIYKNVLYSAAYRCGMKNIFSKALEYNAQLLQIELSEEENIKAENQAVAIQMNSDLLTLIPQLELTFKKLSNDSSEWFEYGKKIATAYYLDKNLDKVNDVLIKIYHTLSFKIEFRENYYLWVLNSLVENNFERKFFDEAYSYAKESCDYISTLSDIPEEQIYYILNNLIVAKIQSNRLEDIDQDFDKLNTYYLNTYGEVSSKYANYLHNRGRAYQLQNKLEEAKKTLLRSITLQNKVEGKPFERTVKYYMEVEQQLGEL